MMIKDLESKKKKISVIGLGYVGLPLALEFAKKYAVVAYDINAERVEMMKKHIDPSNELESSDFEGTDILFTANPDDLKEAHFHIIGVPTPVDNHKVPNLTPVLSASAAVGKALKKGDYVVYESTVYPGCTEEDCIPILEKESGLTFEKDFSVGYSPERINPGDKEHTLTKILKIVAANDTDSLETVADVYGSIIKAGIHKAPCIKVAEAAKVIENTQRDLNIALMNELSIVFDKMNIDTKDVLEAAGTKWNFLKFSPGLVGGHCIGVDPYYLTYKAKKIGYSPQVILSGRKINDDMPNFIAQRLVKVLLDKDINPKNAKVLVLGVTFKENVTDIRNSKVADLIYELQNFSIQTDIYDPHASKEEVKHEYDLELSNDIGSKYDAVIAAVNHNEFKVFDTKDLLGMMSRNPILFDLKGMYDKNTFEKEMTYWRL